MRNSDASWLSRSTMLRTVAITVALAGCMKSHAYRVDTTPTSVLTQHTLINEPIRSAETVSYEVEGTAVRHRMLLDSPAKAARGIANLFAGSPPPAVAQVLTAAVAPDPEKLVIEAWIEMQTEDVAQASAAVRARVEADGGRVVSENIIGSVKAASSAALELRVPPAKQVELITWLATRGVVVSKRVLASDVSKTLFDQELALKNLELTMGRLQKLAEREVPMKELIEIENEMTRVRGEIERLKGEQRFLLDRVAFTTITLTLTREGGPVEFAPHARIHPGAHVSTLSLLDPGGRPRSRVGGGVTIHLQRYLTFDLDAFPARGTDTRAVTATIGSALYSGLLGGGQRRYLNPYLGARAGYGYLSGERCGLFGGEIGLEALQAQARADRGQRPRRRVLPRFADRCRPAGPGRLRDPVLTLERQAVRLRRLEHGWLDAGRGDHRILLLVPVVDALVEHERVLVAALDELVDDDAREVMRARAVRDRSTCRPSAPRRAAADRDTGSRPRR